MIQTMYPTKMLVGPIYKNQKKDVSGGEETCSNPKREEMDALS